MAYLIYAIDHPNRSEARENIREEHRKHLRSVGKKLLASGALLDDDGQTVIGGISLLDTDNYEEAKKFAIEDPYEKAGIRKKLKIIKWRKRWWDGCFLNE
jgi:uncharacterized protein YciI